MLISMCYIMIIYSGIIPLSQVIDIQAPVYASIIVTAMIALANFFVMFRMTYLKLVERCAIYK